jgi:hypothetical protein
VAGHDNVREPVHAKRPPRVTAYVAGDEVPPAARRYQPVRLDGPLAPPAVAVAVVEADALVRARRLRDGHEHVRCDRRRGIGALQRYQCRAQRCDARAQPGRQHLFELGQRRERGVVHALHRAAGRRAQADRDRDGLVVLEQQGRQRAPGTEPVATTPTGRRSDRVPERSQSVDVSAQGPAGDVEAFREFGACPGRARLQEGEQAQEPSRRFGHGPMFARYEDRTCPHWFVGCAHGDHTKQ